MIVLSKVLINSVTFVALSRNILTRQIVSTEKSERELGKLENYKCSRRHFATRNVTKNLNLYTSEPQRHTFTPLTSSKSVVLMFGWFQSNPKHLEKFCSFYGNLGFDILVVTMETLQLFRPVNGSQKVAEDTLKFLKDNERYESILLHGFSLGGYVWGECLVKLHRNPSKYESVVERIKGQVWDSITGSREVPIGIAKALFPKSAFLQETVKQMSQFHLSLFHYISTKHYLRSEDHFHHKPVVVPALLFFSKTDPVGTAIKSLTIAKDFEASGVKVTRKCFENSPHVGHFAKHKEEYKSSLVQHLKLCNLME